MCAIYADRFSANVHRDTNSWVDAAGQQDEGPILLGSRLIFGSLSGSLQTDVWIHRNLPFRQCRDYGLAYNILSITLTLPEFKELYQHLDLWIAKCNHPFRVQENQCLVNFGAAEKKKFPSGLDEKLAARVSELQRNLTDLE